MKKISLLGLPLALLTAGAAFAQDAAAPAAASGDSPYGLQALIANGGSIIIGVLVILVIMSFSSWYIILTKFFEQKKVLNEAATLDKQFWKAGSLDAGRAKLPKNSAFRQLVDDGLAAQEHHEGRLTDKIDQHEWVTMSLSRSASAINSRLTGGLALLASVGSTSPFVGLFGTVVGIYKALIAIGIAGQASIDKVAGPVGEALIMTAIGLAVAVPAVLGYNWLTRRNKTVQDALGNFANDIHSMLVSGGRVQQPAIVVTPSGGPSGATTIGQAVPARSIPAATEAR